MGSRTVVLWLFKMKDISWLALCVYLKSHYCWINMWFPQWLVLQHEGYKGWLVACHFAFTWFKDQACPSSVDLPLARARKRRQKKNIYFAFFFPFLLTWVWLFSLFLCSFGAALHFLGPNNWSNAKGIILRNVQSHPCIASRILDVSILNTSWANISKFTEALVKCHELSLPQKKNVMNCQIIGLGRMLLLHLLCTTLYLTSEIPM